MYTVYKVYLLLSNLLLLPNITRVGKRLERNSIKRGNPPKKKLFTQKCNIVNYVAWIIIYF